MKLTTVFLLGAVAAGFVLAETDKTNPAEPSRLPMPGAPTQTDTGGDLEPAVPTSRNDKVDQVKRNQALQSSEAKEAARPGRRYGKTKKKSMAIEEEQIEGDNRGKAQDKPTNP